LGLLFLGYCLSVVVCLNAELAVVADLTFLVENQERGVLDVVEQNFEQAFV